MHTISPDSLEPLDSAIGTVAAGVSILQRRDLEDCSPGERHWIIGCLGEQMAVLRKTFDAVQDGVPS